MANTHTYRILPSLQFMSVSSLKRSSRWSPATKSVYGISCISLSWLFILIILAGDIHTNPGPQDVPDSLSNTSSASLSQHSRDTLDHHLSFVQYNVQSLRPKLDLLSTELNDIDILAFTETWLGPEVQQSDLCIPSYKTPERKDRTGANYGGVIIYVKDTIHHVRRSDLEVDGLENVWIELRIQKNSFGMSQAVL